MKSDHNFRHNIVLSFVVNCLHSFTALFLFIFFMGAPVTAKDTYQVTVASPDGAAYPIANALAILVNAKLPQDFGISFQVINSPGAIRNIELVRENVAQFIILQSLLGTYFVNGDGPFGQEGGYHELRSVMSLWLNVEHFLIQTNYVKNGTIEDMRGLAGHSVFIGQPDTEEFVSNHTILGHLGIDADLLFDRPDLDEYDAAVEAMLRGEINAISIPAGLSNTAVQDIMAGMNTGVTVLQFTSEQMVRVNGSLGRVWQPYEIPALTYPGQKRNIVTIAQANFLAVRADVSDESVYLMTKTIYENIDFLRNIHPATAMMRLNRAVEGVSIPLHAGALKYYEEVGLHIPGHLK